MRKIILTAVVVICAVAVSAQNTGGSITQQVEVTKDYVPEISVARKLYFQPQIGDTIMLKPDINYSITPTPWKSIFGTKPIAPVSISTAEYSPARAAYIKVASGYPLQTALDFYAATSGDVSRGRFGVYLRHYGQWAETSHPNIPNWSENRLALFGSKTIGKRILDAELGWDVNYYSTYSNSIGNCVASTGYIGADLKITFGDSFTDFSRFNYRFGVSGGSSMGYENADANVFADFGWGLKKGVLLTGVRFDSWFRNDNSRDWAVGLMPEYRIGIKSFSLEAGVKMFYNNYRIYGGNRGNKVGDKFRVIPKLKLQYEVFTELTPYVGIDGDMCSGGVVALNKLNPLAVHDVINRSVFYDARAGVKGSSANMVSYDAFVGYVFGTMPVFVAYNESFMPYIADAGWFYVGASAKLDLPFGLSVELGGQYNKVNADAKIFYSGLWEYLSEDVKKVGTGIPLFKVGGKVMYNYRDKLFLKLGLEYAGTREFTHNIGAIMVKLPSTLNLTADAEYIIKKRYAVFVKGDNLLNSDIYRFLGYRALGANVMAGVRINF